jgi:hypothetical protein
VRRENASWIRTPRLWNAGKRQDLHWLKQYRLPLLSTLTWLLEKQMFSGTSLSKTTSSIGINADKYLLMKLPASNT